MDRLIKDLQVSDLILNSFLKFEVSTVIAQLHLFNDVTSKLKLSVKVSCPPYSIYLGSINSNIQVGLEQLFNQLIRPRLRTFVTDLFKDVSYVLIDDNYAFVNSQNIFARRFIKSWEGLMEIYKVF